MMNGYMVIKIIDHREMHRSVCVCLFTTIGSITISFLESLRSTWTHMRTANALIRLNRLIRAFTNRICNKAGFLATGIINHVRVLWGTDTLAKKVTLSKLLFCSRQWKSALNEKNFILESKFFSLRVERRYTRKQIANHKSWFPSKNEMAETLPIVSNLRSPLNTHIYIQTHTQCRPYLEL